VTCVVGLVDQGHVVIGGDSAGVSGYLLTLRSDPKVFLSGEFIMGFTSSFRMGQLLRYRLQPPKRHPDEDVYQYMVTRFVDAVRDCLKAGGYATKEKEAEAGGTFLVGYAGRLFEIDDDYQVAQSHDNWAACGCGREIALGALHATAGLPVVQRVLKALEAAAYFNIGVHGPFNIVASDDTHEH
jgi:hypothetical protein